MRKIPRHIIHAPLILLCDVILINLASFLALWIGWGRLVSPAESLTACLHVAPFASIAAVILFFVSDLYGAWWMRTATELAYSIASALCILSIVTMAVSFWAHELAFPRSVAIAATLFQIVLITSCRLALRRWYLFVEGRRRALIVAENGASARSLVGRLLHVDTNWFAVSGWLVGNEISELESRISDFDIVLITPGVSHKAELIRRCARIKKDVLLVPEVFELSLFGAKAIELGDVLTFLVRPPRLTPGQRLVKRSIDFIGALVMILAASPLLIIVPLLIKLTSKGPALFRQDRVGRHGHEYTLFKFRTMISDAESTTGPVLASQNDPRITPMGRFLRATRLDELPQLLNVLDGDMSLVGPRPEREFFVSQFRETVPGYEFRFAVKPGITGLAQVHGNYSSSVARKLRFDLMYIYDYSLLFDLKIMLKTISVLFQGSKAEGVVAVVEEEPVEEVPNEMVIGD
jgi:exopolysaccharide biosynthesis polyprenyl glycosylphosphotransferase